VLEDKQAWHDDRWSVPVYDLVDGGDVVVAFGRPGATEPSTPWTIADHAGLDRGEVEALAVGGKLAVFARDNTGNLTIAVVAALPAEPNASGCACDTSGGPGAGAVVVFAVVGVLVLRRRRGHALAAATFAVVLALAATQPGCSCSHAPRSCEMNDECTLTTCPQGEVAFCLEGTCQCSDDIPPGRIGPYSKVAVSPSDGSYWVSAYAQTYGDLVVAQMTGGGRIPATQWQWVDGVPDGPVTVPGATIRGGISDAGPDVGMYTSIAVARDGTPMVAYFDRDNASLKFAAKLNGAWQIHVVDAGTGALMPMSGALVGMYTSLTLRADDGRPGIAYLAHVADAAGEHAEVRYASAQTAVPASAGDWQKWTVDTAVVPSGANDVYPLPEGLGLWISSARDPRNQAPVVAYYDRGAGELKLARFDVTSGTFAAANVLAGSNGIDAGWTPSLQVDAMGVAHVAYVDATAENLSYITDAPGAQVEVVDDGYRIVGHTADGYPEPEYDILADAALTLPPGVGPMVAYQDGTTQELLLAQKNLTTGAWSHISIAGATQPWPGAYGFFVSIALAGTDLVMSSWVIDQPADDNWVELFAKPVASF
jgi:MYXO-CTERM domain-containing protein